MSIGSSITLGKAMQIVGNAIGESNESKQIDAVNDIRTWMYAMQQKISLDLSERFCRPLMKMNAFCNECQDSFIGFRLPQENNSIEAVYYLNRPLDTYSKFRTPYDGSTHGHELAVFDNGYSAFQFDSPLTRSRLHFYAESPKDIGKKIVFVGTTDEGNETITYELSADKQQSRHFTHVSSVQIIGETEGKVNVFDDNSNLLARYEAGEVFPRYRTFNVQSMNECNGSVLVIANRRYTDLTDKNEIVENGNSVVWKSLAKYFYLYDKEGKSSGDRADMNDYMEQAMSLLIEEADVENNENLTTEFRRKKVGYAGLNSQKRGRRGRRWR